MKLLKTKRIWSCSLWWILLFLSFSAKAQNAPDWSVNASDFQFSMTVVASVRVDNVLSADAADQVGVFVNNELRGTAKLNVLIPSSGDQLAFIQVYSNSANGEALTFQIYDASADKVIDAVNAETFEDGKKLGGNQSPYEVSNNTVPSQLQLSNESFDENLESGSIIATLSNNDPDDQETHTYSLVTGEGGEDNDFFVIDGDKLTTVALFNHEEITSVSIRLQVEDSKGASFIDSFTLSVNDVNDDPTAIALSGNSVDENALVNTLIGAFETTDEDTEDVHVYTLVEGTGDQANVMFSLVNGSLHTARVFDFEQQASFSIRIRSTDKAGGTFEQSFLLAVNDINEAPTALSLSATEVDENEGNNVLVATVTSTDEDAGDTHVYGFASGDGDDDNAFFTLRNQGELFAIEDFDFEIKASYTIRLKTQDSGGETFSKSFQLAVNDVNEAPEDMLLSNSSIDENSTDGTIIGNFTSSDPDTGDVHTFALKSGAGDEGNAAFDINAEGQLISSEVFDFEKQSVYSVRVRSTDTEGLGLEKVFIVTINDKNEVSTAITLSNNQLAENNAVGDAIGTLSTTDPDNTETFTYALVEGDGDMDNAAFEIDGSTLKAGATFDHESQSDYTIRLRSTDSQSNELESVFSVTIQDVNETPTALNLSNSTLDENQSESTLIGSLSTTDVDDGDTFVYGFTAGDGDTDNELFTIQNDGELLTTTSFDFETQASYSVRIKSTDQEGASVESSFIVTVIDVNDAPTLITLSQNNLDENNAIDAVIGAFSTSDQDTGDGHSYSLTAGAGDEDNSSFRINNIGELLAVEAFDFEQQSSYSIRVTSTDAANAAFATSFNITINDMNEGSTVIALSDNQLAENNAAGDVIGTFSTTDPDNAETFTYALVTGDGDTDNAAFEIEGSTLKAGQIFDHESQSGYSIRVRSTDSQSNELESVFSVTIQDVNEIPTALNLSNSTLDENQSESTQVGSLSTTDVDDGDAFVYSFTTGDGDTNNELFTIQNDSELFTTTSFDFETQASYSVRIKSTDQEGASVENNFIVTVVDVNDAPTSLTLSQSDLDENNAIDAVIGAFSTTDQDTGDSHSYSLTGGAGDEDNDSFAINSSGELLAAEAFDFEQQSSYSVRVTSTDAANATFATSFTIVINDVNEGSTVIALSDNQLSENNAIGDAIGTLSTTDPDNAETFTYALVTGDGGTDNAAFEIDGSTLKAGQIFDHETQSSYSIRVRSTDSQSNELESVFSVTIQDVNETPTALSLFNSSLDENQSESTRVGTLSTTDADDGDAFVYSFTTGDGDTDNELFTIQNDGELFTTTSFDFETQASYSVRIKSTDQEGASVETSFIVTVTDVNDAPTLITLTQNALDENNAIDAVIGAFSTADQDTGDSHNYSLTAGAGDEDNGSFAIKSSGELLAAEAFDFEQKSSYSIRVTSTDVANAAFTTSFTIVIKDVNESSTVIALSDNQLEENNAIGDVIGSLSTTDPDNAESFTYALVTGDGDADNAAFEIDGNALKAASGFDYETKSSYAIRIRSTASDGGVLESVFTVEILDVNDAPTAVMLSNQSTDENNTSDQLIGELSTQDQDLTDSHVYSLTSGSGDAHNSFFAIRNTNELVLTASADFETNEQLELRVLTIDNAGSRLESAFVIEVGNLPEPAFEAVDLLDFGLTGKNESSEQTLNITNSGPDGNLEITAVSITGPFNTAAGAATLTPGEQLAISLSFTPTEVGELNGNITFQTNVGEKVVALTGIGELVTGIEDLPDFSSQVKVFPNPADELLTINTTLFSFQPFDLRMVNASGSMVVVRDKIRPTAELKLDVSRIESGIYLLILSDGKHVAKKKVMIR